MSKKTIAILSLSFLTLAACTAPADNVEDVVLDEELPPMEDIFIDDFIMDEEIPDMDGEPIVEEVLLLDEEAVVDTEVEVDAEAEGEILE